MCGIAGAIGPRERADETSAEVRRMLYQLARRGPDGFGQRALGGVVLGHSRLAIIDLETGEQPQSNEDETVWVVVNGEIYNYVELRADLEERGHRFRTQSDIEVIPHLFDEYGAAFVEHLRGMFAIALWDTREEQLLLVRDRLGKKPLYYLETGDGFYFASEIKSLLQLGVAYSLDHQALEDYFTFQYIPAPRTAFKEIKKLPAAHMLRRQGRRSELTEYWTLPNEIDESLTEESALERIDGLLDEAVRLRLRSDVPLGAFLSAGIDSTLVVSSAARLLDEPLLATTIAFDGSNEAEVATARRVAEKFGARHEIKRAAADIRDVFDRVAGYLDEPLGDSSTLPSYLVARATREEVKVAISGDGGDETFGGYAWRYYQNLLLDRIRGRIPGRLGRHLVGIAASLYPKLDQFPKPLRLKWGLRNLSVSAEEAYFLDMSIFRPEDKDALYRREFRRELGSYSAAEGFSAHFSRCGSRDLLSRLLFVDLKTYLADGVLAKVDRMSMANSLEVRSPLLDHRLVELAATIPPELKLKGKTSKYLLRRLAARNVGEEVASAPKVGFAPPLSRWLANELREIFRELVLDDSRGVHLFLDSRVIEAMFQDHVAGRRDHARPLWLILNFELWYRNFGVKAAW